MKCLQPLLTNDAFMQRVRETLPKTGASLGTTQEIAKEFQSTVYSPQFQESLSLFSAAFQTGRLASLIEQFELGPDCVVAASQGGKFFQTFLFYYF